MPDGCAGRVEGDHRDATLGPLGEVGAQRYGVTGQRRDPAGEVPALPHPPRVGVDGLGGFGAGDSDRRGDTVGAEAPAPRIGHAAVAMMSNIRQRRELLHCSAQQDRIYRPNDTATLGVDTLQSSA